MTMTIASAAKLKTRAIFRAQVLQPLPLPARNARKMPPTKGTSVRIVRMGKSGMLSRPSPDQPDHQHDQRDADHAEIILDPAALQPGHDAAAQRESPAASVKAEVHDIFVAKLARPGENFDHA